MVVRRERWLLYGVPLLCLLLLAGGWFLGRERLPTSPPEQPKLVLYSGDDVRPAVEDIIQAFQRRYGIQVEVRYGPAEQLLDQLESTRAGDVFLPCDAYSSAKVERRGLAGYRRQVARLVPVIQVARGNPENLTSLSDLAAPGIRVAVAEGQATAIGRITPALFRKNTVPAEAIASNAVFKAEMASELGQAVAARRADAAVNWRPVALQYPLTEVVAIPAESNIVAVVEAMVLSTASDPEQARLLVDFLGGPAAREAFARHHYDLVEP